MSEPPNQSHKKQAEPPPFAPASPESSSQYGSSPLLNRMMFIFLFLLFVGVTVAFSPQIAKQIAYSWNIGAERAKAEVARQFLHDNPLSVTEQRTVWVANAVAPSVVAVHTTTTKPPIESQVQWERSNLPDWIGTDVGSGVVVDDRGYILTNQHVIADALDIRVQLSDGRVVNAELIGQDRVIDLAVLRINADNLQTIDWGDSRQVTVGERVLAIGSPFTLQQTITSGIISATDRYNAIRVMRGSRARTFPHAFLQTDAAINPGNSGGALVDMNGKLIGICTSNISINGGNSGIGFAIPSAMAKHVYEEMMAHSEIRRGWIGVQAEELIWFDAQQIGQERPQGAIIVNFLPGSPARIAGLRHRDIIMKWGEIEIDSPLHLIHLVTLTAPDTIVPVEVFRRGEILTLDITVGSRPLNL